MIEASKPTILKADNTETPGLMNGVNPRGGGRGGKVRHTQAGRANARPSERAGEKDETSAGAARALACRGSELRGCR